MATAEEWKIVREALTPLCEPLYRCADRSQELAESYFLEHGMLDSEHPGGRAHLARHHLRHHLKREPDLGGWSVSGPRPNGEVRLRLSTMTLRVLRPGPKLNETFPPPPPGSNRARISYYRNPKLSLFGAMGSNLIGIWYVDPEIEGLTIRIVRPIRDWKMGQYEFVDIDFTLPRLGTALDSMEFDPTDEDILLPAFDTAEEDEENADSADG
jgi:hypothetical protein